MQPVPTGSDSYALAMNATAGTADGVPPSGHSQRAVISMPRRHIRAARCPAATDIGVADDASVAMRVAWRN